MVFGFRQMVLFMLGPLTILKACVCACACVLLCVQKTNRQTDTYCTSTIVLSVQSLNPVLARLRGAAGQNTALAHFKLSERVVNERFCFKRPPFFDSESVGIAPLRSDCTVASAVDKRDGVSCASVCPLQST